MKNNLNTRVIGTALTGCVLGMVAAQSASAAVSDEDFNALKSVVQQLQKAHDQDQQQIQKLQQQLGDTQTLVQKTDATVQAQSASVVRNALHNFTMVGDAEVQYAKSFGNDTHGGFLLADYAPIFLYRANDNVLFEAGFDIMLNNGTTGTHDNGSSTSLSMSFGQLDYILNDYMTLSAAICYCPWAPTVSAGPAC